MESFGGARSVPVTGAFIGAHVGSLVGALGQMKEDGTLMQVKIRRRCDMLVAVSVPEDRVVEGAVDVLQSLGAVDIEHARQHHCRWRLEGF